MASDIDHILYPTALPSLREDMPPVQCMIWKGGNEYETITFDQVYPFDTVDHIKRLICHHYQGDTTFIPRFLFVGVPRENTYDAESQPTLATTYLSIDYLWFPNGTNDTRKTYFLSNPAQFKSDTRFVTSDGSYASPNFVTRGRSTLEQVFLIPSEGKIPVFHVFSLTTLLREYKGVMPIGEDDWNKRFAPYFPNVPFSSPHDATDDDIAFSKKIAFFVTQREKTIYRINELLEGGVNLPTATLSGVRQLLLTWKKPIRGFEGSASLFYKIHVTEKRPYLRLHPAEGSPITKLHVKGVVPIPSLDDPHVLEVWGKETSPTPGMDFCSMKYIHRPASGRSQPPIYGTIHLFNDGTMNLLLQPPKNIRKLEPNLDFRNITGIFKDVFSNLPQPFDNFQLKEIAAIFTINIGMKSNRFTKSRILKRLPYFQTFFNEIKPLPEENPLISLRFKAVSQYATEDKIFTFITQLSTLRSLDGESPDHTIIDAIQNEFYFSKKEATDALANWYKNRGIFTLQLPEEGEFIESFNPGIDIHIHAQHPAYYVHVNRIDSITSYTRIYTLLSLLFIAEDDYFMLQQNSEPLDEVSAEVEAASILNEQEEEKKKEENIMVEDPFAEPDRTASSVPGWIAEDPFANEANAVNYGEVFPENAPNPIAPNPIAPNPVAAPAATVKAVPIAKKVEMDEEQKMINPKSWFIKKLQELDKRLFQYKSDVSDENGYSRKCAGHDDRQPSILTKDQYERMREIYEDDPIFWLVYPLEGDTDPIQPLGKEETITIMRYGSNSDSIHYYFCPKYYCLNDEIMIREKDFEAIEDRDGNPKPPNTCPFCYGKLIEDKREAVRGATVIKRKDKKGTTTHHTYIDFMTKTTHPEKFSLPCCFLKQTTLRIKDPQFAHIRTALQQTIGEEKEEDNEDEDDYDNLVYRGDEIIEYAFLFESIHKRYILESNKHPDPGVFATIPPQFDKFFKQNSGEKMVTRVAIHLKLRPTAQGFMRIGTENTSNESLLGVIAPLLFKNSIFEVKERLKEVMVPRIFINAHFGNLVLEFYNPADGRAMPSTRQALMMWTQQHLGIAVNSINLYPLLRIYNAYHRFIQFIDDPTQRKDLRHIQPLLAEPGLFTSRGLQLIVMDTGSQNEVTIKCPTFGLSMDRHKMNDIAFISRSIRSVGTSAWYELYIYTSNTPAKGGDMEVHDTIVRWDYASRRVWPAIVKQRVDEYMNQCQSKYRSLYTSHDGIHPMAMIPLSKAVSSAPYQPEGIIKDSYNHIVGVTFRSKPGSQLMVALPVVDDGIISISTAFSVKNIYLDWEDFKPAAIEDVVHYYRTTLEPLFALYPGYRIKYIAKHKLENKIVGVQLENGIYLPASPPKDKSAFERLDLETVMIEQLEWRIDKELAGLTSKNNADWDKVIEETSTEEKCGTDPELRNSSYADLDELYQQFRLMVSNWITSQKAGSEIRTGIAEIIFNKNLPEYERRKRLYIYISSTLLSWFYPDTEQWESTSTSFLRKDCRVIDSPEACSGTCHWNESEAGGKCLLHVHAQTTLSGNRIVSTPELFTKRIIDELIRFPHRREQILNQGEISKVSAIIKPIRQGDQYIIPESSPTWTNLLRLDWSRQIPEEAKYYEEMTADKEEITLPAGSMPPEEIFGSDTPFRLKVPETSSKSLMPFTSILGITLDQLGVDTNATQLSVENLVNYVRFTSKPIGIITIQSDDSKIQFVRPGSGTFQSVTILVFLEDKIGLLVEEDGNPMITISNLPEEVQQRWQSAGIVQLKKRIEPTGVPIVKDTQQIQLRRPRLLVAQPSAPRVIRQRQKVAINAANA